MNIFFCVEGGKEGGTFSRIFFILPLFVSLLAAKVTPSKPILLLPSFHPPTKYPQQFVSQSNFLVDTCHGREATAMFVRFVFRTQRRRRWIPESGHPLSLSFFLLCSAIPPIISIPKRCCFSSSSFFPLRICSVQPVTVRVYWSQSPHSEAQSQIVRWGCYSTL